MYWYIQGGQKVSIIIRCYGVKYVRFLLFLIFYISQSSVATRLTCGG